MRDFGTLVRLAQDALSTSAQGRELLDTISAHLGTPAGGVAVVVEEVAAHRFVDADIVLTAVAGPDARLVGIGGGDQRHHSSLSDMLQQSALYPNFPLAQPDYVNLPVGPAEQRQTVALGLRLLSFDRVPRALLQRSAEPRYGRMSASLEVLCEDPAVTKAFLAEFRQRMRSESVLKGQVLSCTADNFGSGDAGVTFHERPTLSPTTSSSPTACWAASGSMRSASTPIARHS